MEPTVVPKATPILTIRTINGNKYELTQENGQRKYGGPPPDWNGKPVPEKGSEIFIGILPRDCYEEELLPVFERIGTIYEFRLMLDFSGSNRGYAFCTYTCKQDSLRAIKELNNYEVRKGRLIGVCASVDNCRLFIGGIPVTRRREEVQKEMEKVTDGVVNVILYPCVTDKSRNRGYGFVEYRTHRDAAMARRKLIPGRIQLWGHKISVDWAEPELMIAEDVMSNVRILFVRNLMLETTEETLKELFEEASRTPGSVFRVKKIKDFAFIHFRKRQSAEEALSNMNGVEIDGSKVEVLWAKPSDKSNVKTLEDIFPQEDDGALQEVISTQPLELFERECNAYESPIAWSYMCEQTASTRYYSSFNRCVKDQGRGAAGLKGAGALYRGYMHAYLQNAYKRYLEKFKVCEVASVKCSGFYGLSILRTTLESMSKRRKDKPIVIDNP